MTKTRKPGLYREREIESDQGMRAAVFVYPTFHPRRTHPALRSSLPGRLSCIMITACQGLPSHQSSVNFSHAPGSQVWDSPMRFFSSPGPANMLHPKVYKSPPKRYIHKAAILDGAFALGALGFLPHTHAGTTEDYLRCPGQGKCCTEVIISNCRVVGLRCDAYHY